MPSQRSALKEYTVKRNPVFQRPLIIVILLFLAGGTLSCVREEGARIQVWIDSPRDGYTAPLGKPISIISHTYARQGIAEIVLSVNGEAYRRDAPTEAGTDFCEIWQEWIPVEPGIYTLQVRAYDTQGEISQPASISVRVLGDVAPEMVAPPTVTISPELPITPTLVTITPTEETVPITCPPMATG